MLVSSAIMTVSFLFLAANRNQGPVPDHLSLRSFPDNVDGWTGTPVPMSKKERSILNADDVASILYTKKSGDSGIFFFSAYYQHQTPEKNIHSPKNCLPSSGWLMEDNAVISVPLKDGGTPEQINRVVIEKGLSKQVVLYWYQERGRIFSNEYWGRFYLIKDALTLHRTDGALVRVSMPMEGSVDQTVQKELSFIRSLTPLLSGYIPGRGHDGLSRSLHTSKNHLNEDQAPSDRIVALQNRKGDPTPDGH